ncbi:MAG TPA: hypothetical protein VFD84_14570 [Candidatus Binatia bacterium]|nr:hypothetical protein [Candidatus Binatia bacterium]
MGRGRGRGRRRATEEPPIPLEPVDLLAGLASGIELVAGEAATDGDGAELTGVGEVGKMIRSGDGTVRRLIRTATLRPAAPNVPSDVEPDRAGVLPRTPDKPGE